MSTLALEAGEALDRFVQDVDASRSTTLQAVRQAEREALAQLTVDARLETDLALTRIDGAANAEVARATVQAGLAQVARMEAAQARADALHAARAAQRHNAAVTYDTVAEGLAATADGESWVAVEDGWLYRNEAGTAVRTLLYATTGPGGDLQLPGHRTIRPELLGVDTVGGADVTADLQSAIDEAIAGAYALDLRGQRLAIEGQLSMLGAVPAILTDAATQLVTTPTHVDRILRIEGTAQTPLLGVHLPRLTIVSTDTVNARLELHHVTGSTFAGVYRVGGRDGAISTTNVTDCQIGPVVSRCASPGARGLTGAGLFTDRMHRCQIDMVYAEGAQEVIDWHESDRNQISMLLGVRVGEVWDCGASAHNAVGLAYGLDIDGNGVNFKTESTPGKNCGGNSVSTLILDGYGRDGSAGSERAAVSLSAGELYPTESIAGNSVGRIYARTSQPYAGGIRLAIGSGLAGRYGDLTIGSVDIECPASAIAGRGASGVTIGAGRLLTTGNAQCVSVEQVHRLRIDASASAPAYTGSQGAVSLTRCEDSDLSRAVIEDSGASGIYARDCASGQLGAVVKRCARHGLHEEYTSSYTDAAGERRTRLSARGLVVETCGAAQDKDNLFSHYIENKTGSALLGVTIADEHHGVGDIRSSGVLDRGRCQNNTLDDGRLSGGALTSDVRAGFLIDGNVTPSSSHHPLRAELTSSRSSESMVSDRRLYIDTVVSATPTGVQALRDHPSNPGLYIPRSGRYALRARTVWAAMPATISLTTRLVQEGGAILDEATALSETGVQQGTANSYIATVDTDEITVYLETGTYVLLEAEHSSSNSRSVASNECRIWAEQVG